MKNNIHRLTFSALFLALGLVFPQAFHVFGPNAGMVLLPMHIPVLLCGLLCGPFYGALVGILTPLLSSLLTGMPMLMPVGVSMMFELMAYGLMSGWMMKRFPIYISLITAMLVGRMLSGIANFVLLGYMGKTYTLSIFLGSAFATAVPGIILQLLLIPVLVSIIFKWQGKEVKKI